MARPGRRVRISGNVMVQGGTVDTDEQFSQDGVAVTASSAEVNKLTGVTAGAASASKAAVLGANKELDEFHTAALYLGAGAGTLLTPTAAEFNRLAGLGGTPIFAAERTFTETSGAGVYTGSVTIPAGATLLDIIINGVALWDNAGACTLKVGDVADDDGYFTAVNLKATDLLAGESLSFESAGGKAGAYIANSQVSPRYSASQRVISGIVTTASTGGSAGRTRMTVVWSMPVAADISAATKV